jgi:predicted XRE-type DNA-binding protein
MSSKTGTPKIDEVVDDDSVVKVRIVDNFLASQGYKNPEEMRAKFLLSTHIENVIVERGLSQAAAANIAGVAQSDISRIINAKLDGFSLWKLGQIASALGVQTELHVRLPSGETESIAVA